MFSTSPDHHRQTQAPTRVALKFLDLADAFGYPAGVNYPGSKNGMGVYQAIINQIPPHSLYIEPFLGGGAIFSRKLPARTNLGLDLDRVAVAAVAEETGCVIARSVADAYNYFDDADKSGYASASAVVCGCAISFLANHRSTGDEFIYLDPPYLQETRRSKANIYQHEFKREGQHEELLSLILNCRSRVAISGYPSRLYAERLKDWRLITFEAMTRAGRKATEYLWMNYPEPMTLHDNRFLGLNKTDRQRIKRKKESFANKLRKMSLIDRQAVLSAIEELKGDAGQRR